MVAEIVKKLQCMYEMQKVMRFHMNLPLEPTATLFQSTTPQLIYLTSILILSEGSPYILFRSSFRTKLYSAFLV